MVSSFGDRIPRVSQSWKWYFRRKLDIKIIGAKCTLFFYCNFAMQILPCPKLSGFKKMSAKMRRKMERPKECKMTPKKIPEWTGKYQMHESMREAHQKKISEARTTKKSTKKPKQEVNDSSKSEKRRSLRLTDDALDVLKAITDNRKTLRLSQDAFASEAICKYGKELLKDDFPTLREAPAGYVAERLEYLERMTVKRRWKELAEKSSVLAKYLASMAQELQFEPPIVDMDKANVWLKEHGKSNARGKTFKLDDVIAAAYARKLGLLDENDDEE